MTKFLIIFNLTVEYSHVAATTADLFCFVYSSFFCICLYYRLCMCSYQLYKDAQFLQEEKKNWFIATHCITFTAASPQSHFTAYQKQCQRYSRSSNLNGISFTKHRLAKCFLQAFVKIQNVASDLKKAKVYEHFTVN